MTRILRNESGAMMIQVLAIGLLVAVLALWAASYNTTLRTDTSNKIKRYVKRDLEIIVRQNVIQPQSIMGSETVLGNQNFP